MDTHLERHNLFPKIDPFGEGMLSLDGNHVMYWEESGNPDGVPVLFLHGGPGAGANSAHRRFFDPEFYRIVIFDQRGAGRSRPYADVSDNNTWHLVDDIEALRAHLDIERWLVFGGSWGSTLALAYAIKHPDRALGFVLRGIFLGGKDELDWFLGGMQVVFPEAWRAFTGFLPDDERDDILDSYHRRLMDSDPNVHGPAAAAWNRYETSCSTLLTSFDDGPPGSGGPSALALARLEVHYFVNDMFLEDGYLLANVDKVAHLPAVIVQGRYDMVCPTITADRLAGAWPGAEYVIVKDAGHSAMEPGIRTALVKATQDMKDRLKP